MISFTWLFVFTLILIQEVQSYCIYNKLTDGSSIDVYQAYTRNSAGKDFNKRIDADHSECCPYTNYDCSYRRVNDDVAGFFFYFHWPTISTNRYYAECTTGGGLNIFGEHQNHYALCRHANDTVTEVKLYPAAPRS